MNKKNNKKKVILLAETVEKCRKNKLWWLPKAPLTNSFLEEVIGIKEEMDRNVKKTNQKLTDIELLVERSQ